jgi:hypothetical protein
MKSQTDLIFMIAGAVITLLVVILSFTVFHRQVTAPTPPTPVVVSEAPLPTAAPVMVAALPSGGGNSGRSGFGGGGFGGGAFSGGPAVGGSAGTATPSLGMSKGKSDFMKGVGGGK